MKIRMILAAVVVTTLPLLAYAQTPAPQPQPKKPAATAPKPAAKPATKLAPAATPAAAPAAAAPSPPTGPIGTVALVTGRVTATAAVLVRALGAGDPIFEGQTITVGPNSYASLKFNDGGRVLLRPDTEFIVEAFRSAALAAPAPAPAAGTPSAVTTPAPAAVAGNAFFRLVRGGFRAVTGLIGKADRADYKVTTPAATIGIRGTDFEVVTCSDDCPSRARAAAGHTEVASNSLEGLELAQASPSGGATGSGGIVVATHDGAIVLRTPQGETVVNVGQVALALASGQTFMLPKVPDVMLQTPVPAPETCE
jgi:hypothetical protein